MAEPRERISEWSGIREALARVEDALRANTAVAVAAAGGKPGTVQPVPRPVTALDRVKRARRLAEHRALVAKLTGISTDTD